jgi:hypothetical protein
MKSERERGSAGERESDTFTGLNTSSGPFRNQIARLVFLPLVKVTLKGLVAPPGWKAVVWPRS